MTSVHNSEKLAQSPPDEPESRICFKKIGLNPDISKRNFAGCLIHYFMLSFVFVSIDLLQPMLLFQKFTVKRSEEFHNMKNALVIGCDIAVKILVAPFFGYLADRLGRKIVNSYGILIIAMSMVIIPFCQEFWQYVLARMFYAHGAIAISVVPLLADYIHNDSKGTCAAILVLMSSFGALGSAELNMTLLNNVDSESKITIQYLSAAGITFFLGMGYSLFCIKAGTTYYTRRKEKKTCAKMIQTAKESAKVPEISLGYMSAFLARCDSILLSLFLVLWVYSFDPKEDDYDKANSHASMLSGITYLVIMLSCILFGVMFQRGKNIKWMIVTMLGMAALGTLSINLVTEVNSYLLYVSLIILGIGMSGLLTASLYLVNAFADQEHRGYITGLQTWSGIVGICFQTLLGALLMDNTNRSGPFNLFGGMCILFIPLTFYLYKNRSNSPLMKEPLIDENKKNSVLGTSEF